MITFEPFFITANAQRISLYRLKTHLGISSSTLSSMRANQSISTRSLQKLCFVLSCEPNDIFQVYQDAQVNEETLKANMPSLPHLSRNLGRSGKPDTVLSFRPLFDTMKEISFSQSILSDQLDRKTIDTLRKNKHIRTETIEKLCLMLGCQPNNILEFVVPKDE